MRIAELTTEYQKDPIGLDALPRFSWKIESERKNTLQRGYRLQVKTRERILWDSGEVESSQSLFVEYEGEELLPFTIYGVEVRVWDNHGETGQARGFFETGLLSRENWRAEWITHSLPPEETACPVFRKDFFAENKKISRARAYVTCRGVYELTINGKKAGDCFLAPGWTSYHNRLQYQTYDITELLAPPTGEKQCSRAEITVGNGWYKGYLNGEGQNCFYGDRTGVMAMIRILYEDGSVQEAGTGPDWEVTTGVIRFSELYHGERQDFTYGERGGEPAGQAAVFDQAGKNPQIVDQQSEPVRVTKRLPAREKLVTPRGELVLDFGQNLAGFVEVRLPKLTGKALVISHAETLDKEGNFYTENLRTARSRDEYIYTDREVGRLAHPHFTYHGFRYIRLEGVDREVDEGCFTACALHTDMRQTGHFSCTHPLVSRLQKNIEWGQRSNFVDIPTDCPQRDERLGWTGDAQIFCGTAMYNFNAALFYKKWLRDMAAESDEARGIPQMVPDFMGNSVGTSVWGDSATIIPWTLYQVYGDEAVLREQYPNMRQWVDYITDACGESGLWTEGFQRGDWLGLDGDQSLGSLSGGTDKNLVANAYYAYSCRIVRDTAEILGDWDGTARYGDLYERIVSELNREYVTPNGRLVSETQTACALLLHFGLLREEYRGRVVRTLEENLSRHHGHLTTGFVGTAYLCHALTENGKHSLAENILLSQEYPGWLYAVNRGATTIWERWDSVLPDGDLDDSGMNSLNHYAYGAIGDWLYRRAAGINPLKGGYKKILIKPVLTRGLPEVEASFQSMYGEISCRLRCRDGLITVEAAIPANTTAVLELPERAERIEVGSGVWHYEYATDTSLEIERYSMDSTFEEILASREAADIVEKHMPGIADSKMMAFLGKKTLNEMAAMAPRQKGQLEAMLRELNR